MEAIEFTGANITIAKDQPQYHPIPAHINHGGIVTCCWKLTPEEIAEITRTGLIWHRVLTFRQPFQPQQLLVERPVLEDVRSIHPKNDFIEMCSVCALRISQSVNRAIRIEDLCIRDRKMFAESPTANGVIGFDNENRLTCEIKESK